MVPAKRNRQIRFYFALIIAAAAVLTASFQPLSAQFNNERRRSDLNPIVLPGGSRIEFKSFDSKSINGLARYSIFLPPSFSKDLSRTYPVIYFLHGLNNDETSWTVERYSRVPAAAEQDSAAQPYGKIQIDLEQMMTSGKVPELIMVHPRGDSSFYCNFIDGSKRYEDLLTQELIAHMETNYRARKGRENRALAGTSMGGYGALKIAMKYPDRYAAAVGQSPIIFPGSNPLELSEEAKSSRFYSFFLNMLTPIFGNPIRQDLWDANNPLTLAKTRKLDGLRIYFDYGTEDRYIPMAHLDEGCKALHDILNGAGVPHIFKIRPGEPHGWALVAAHMDETLSFLCQTFKK